MDCCPVTACPWNEGGRYLIPPPHRQIELNLTLHTSFLASLKKNISLYVKLQRLAKNSIPAITSEWW